MNIKIQTLSTDDHPDNVWRGGVWNRFWESVSARGLSNISTNV